MSTPVPVRKLHDLNSAIDVISRRKYDVSLTPRFDSDIMIKWRKWGMNDVEMAEWSLIVADISYRMIDKKLIVLHDIFTNIQRLVPMLKQQKLTMDENEAQRTKYFEETHDEVIVRRRNFAMHNTRCESAKASYEKTVMELYAYFDVLYAISW